MGNFDQPIISALNHLIREETWARERLRPFSGSQLRIAAGPISLSLRIDEHGLFTHGDSTRSIDVVLALPADTPFKLLLDRNSLFSSVKLSGSADLAEALAFVFRNLRWDIESDLAQMVGDIPARRLTRMGTQLGAQIQDSVKRSSLNMAEYATEDSGLLAATRDIQAFGKAVDDLRDDTARLAKRVECL